MARFLIDEDTSPQLANRLNEHGHDAVTARQLGLAGKRTPDTVILVTAIELDRIVVTENHGHFLELHQFLHRLARAWRVPEEPGHQRIVHHGILTVPQMPEHFMSLTEAEISRFVGSRPSLMNELHFWAGGHHWRPFPVPPPPRL